MNVFRMLIMHVGACVNHRGGLCFSNISSDLRPLLSERAGPQLLRKVMEDPFLRLEALRFLSAHNRHKHSEQKPPTV
ncbi:hypothetical protein AMECASPLE_032922 [Ameca splendens]|uniref:Uncharacterized protein n=1 Tax=Ameca splendens TaxID=208324 RepID=A0ABV0YI53_9TELE